MFYRNKFDEIFYIYFTFELKKTLDHLRVDHPLGSLSTVTKLNQYAKIGFTIEL